MDQYVRRALFESTDAVQLVVPPSSEYLRTVRLVAADAAVRAGLDCEEIEDFRIAVDELCHLLMTSTDHFLELRVVATDDCVIAEGVALGRIGAPATRPNELSELILASTTDYYGLDAHNGELSFTAVKQTRRVLADQR
jgi:hypothetical protein